MGRRDARFKRATAALDKFKLAQLGVIPRCACSQPWFDDVMGVQSVRRVGGALVSSLVGRPAGNDPSRS